MANLNTSLSQGPENNADATPEKASTGSTLRFLLQFALAAWVLRTFLIASFSIPSGSMEPTMAIGDYLFVSKWPYGYSRQSMTFGVPSFEGRLFSRLPERGDIIVFVGPQGNDVVKRAIGLPGDMIEVREGQLILNGTPVPRQRIGDVAITVSENSPCRRVTLAGPVLDPSVGEGQPCRYPAFRETLPNGVSYTTLDQVEGTKADNFGPVTVPQDTVFFMGDNRDDSLDSRYSPAEGGMGYVPMENLVGRAQFSFWSTDGSASWINPISWFQALRTDRLFIDFHQ